LILTAKGGECWEKRVVLVGDNLAILNTQQITGYHIKISN
jgi:hypothetical protein